MKALFRDLCVNPRAHNLVLNIVPTTDNYYNNGPVLVEIMCYLNSELLNLYLNFYVLVVV